MAHSEKPPTFLNRIALSKSSKEKWATIYGLEQLVPGRASNTEERDYSFF